MFFYYIAYDFNLGLLEIKERVKKTNGKIKVLIADDEALARKRILKFLGESDIDIQIIEASTGKETIRVLNSEKPDLVFLDIKMTDMTGFDVLQKVPSENIPIIIFVTAFDTFAVKAFEVQAIDFLLKPYKKARFIEAFDRGINQIYSKSQSSFQEKVTKLMGSIHLNEDFDKTSKASYLDQVVLKLNKKYYFVNVEDIKYVQSSSYYAEIFTKENKKHVYRISMNDFMEKLNPRHFSRINRSTIINIKLIKEVVSEGLGDFSVILKDGSSFAVTKNYKSSFLYNTGIKT